MRLWKLIIVGSIAAVILWWLYPSRGMKTKKVLLNLFFGRRELIFSTWNHCSNISKKENPEYKVVIGQAAARDMVADPQRFLCSVAGDMSPDVIMFDRYAVSEWASRGAFQSVNKYLAADRTNLNITYPINTNVIVIPALNEVTYKDKCTAYLFRRMTGFFFITKTCLYARDW